MKCDLFEYELVLDKKGERKIPGSKCSLHRTFFQNMTRVVDNIKSLPIYHLPFMSILIEDLLDLLEKKKKKK